MKEHNVSHVYFELYECKIIKISSLAFYERSDLITKEEGGVKPGTLVIALTSDRGLCGAVHSGIAKKVKLTLNTDTNAENIKVITIGDKAKAMLAR